MRTNGAKVNPINKADSTVKKSTRQTPLSRNQHGKLEILFLQASFTKRKFKVAMNRRTWTSRAGLMVAWSPPDLQRLLNQLHSGNKVFENINFCEPSNVFHCVNICTCIFARIYYVPIIIMVAIIILCVIWSSSPWSSSSCSSGAWKPHSKEHF